jgi:hypothetical protein
MDRVEQTELLVSLVKCLALMGVDVQFSDARPRVIARLGAGPAVSVTVSDAGEFTWQSAHGSHAAVNVKVAAQALLFALRGSVEVEGEKDGRGSADGR